MNNGSPQGSDSDELIKQRVLSYFRENTDFVKTIFDGFVGYGIIAADFDGNILAYNEGAFHMFGYTPQEIIGRQSIEIFFPKDFIESGKYQELIDNLIANLRFSYEGEKVRKNGEKFPASVLFILTKNKDDSIVGFIEIVEDITERKQAEEKIKKQVEELERFKKATIQRELRMKELKDRLEKMEKGRE
ncbi:MAG: PAS domain S-box protein [Nitrospinae bacterium]|nr:PAS domain S-box protein [Nitrospinota bacterium]